jgi:hypothetical protein
MNIMTQSATNKTSQPTQQSSSASSNTADNTKEIINTTEKAAPTLILKQQIEQFAMEDSEKFLHLVTTTGTEASLTGLIILATSRVKNINETNKQNEATNNSLIQTYIDYIVHDAFKQKTLKPKEHNTLWAAALLVRDDIKLKTIVEKLKRADTNSYEASIHKSLNDSITQIKKSGYSQINDAKDASKQGDSLLQIASKITSLEGIINTLKGPKIDGPQYAQLDINDPNGESGAFGIFNTVYKNLGENFQNIANMEKEDIKDKVIKFLDHGRDQYYSKKENQARFLLQFLVYNTTLCSMGLLISRGQMVNSAIKLGAEKLFGLDTSKITDKTKFCMIAITLLFTQYLMSYHKIYRGLQSTKKDDKKLKIANYLNLSLASAGSLIVTAYYFNVFGENSKFNYNLEKTGKFLYNNATLALVLSSLTFLFTLLYFTQHKHTFNLTDLVKILNFKVAKVQENKGFQNLINSSKDPIIPDFTTLTKKQCCEYLEQTKVKFDIKTDSITELRNKVTVKFMSDVLEIANHTYENKLLDGNEQTTLIKELNKSHEGKIKAMNSLGVSLSIQK